MRCRKAKGYIRLLAMSGLARRGLKVDLGVAQRAMNQRDSDSRFLAVEVFEAAGGPVALENLEEALVDESMRVRTRAAGALLSLLDPKRRSQNATKKTP